MKTPLFFTGSSTSNLSSAADRFAVLAGGGPAVAAWGTTAAGEAVRAPCAGTVSNLIVRFATALVQGSYTVTLLKGPGPGSLSPTALTAQVSASGSTAADTANAVSVAEGDYLAWRVVPSGNPTAQASSVQIACLFTSVADDCSPVFSHILAGSAAGSVGLGCGAAATGTELNGTVIMPCAGTAAKMVVDISAAPGAGSTRTITLRKGSAAGALADTALTVTFAAGDTARALDLGGAGITLAAGDFLSIRQTISGTPASATVRIGLAFVPATSGQAPRFAIVTGSPSASATRYAAMSGASGGAEATESNVAQPCPGALTLTGLRHGLATAPGAGKSRAARLRRNGVDTALVALTADAAVTGVSSGSVSLQAGDRVDLALLPSGTPAASAWQVAGCIMVVGEERRGDWRIGLETGLGL